MQKSTGGTRLTHKTAEAHDFAREDYAPIFQGFSSQLSDSLYDYLVRTSTTASTTAYHTDFLHRLKGYIRSQNI